MLRFSFKSVLISLIYVLYSCLSSAIYIVTTSVQATGGLGVEHMLPAGLAVGFALNR